MISYQQWDITITYINNVLIIEDGSDVQLMMQYTMQSHYSYDINLILCLLLVTSLSFSYAHTTCYYINYPPAVLFIIHTNKLLPSKVQFLYLQQKQIIKQCQISVASQSVTSFISHSSSLCFTSQLHTFVVSVIHYCLLIKVLIHIKLQLLYPLCRAQKSQNDVWSQTLLQVYSKTQVLVSILEY